MTAKPFRSNNSWSNIGNSKEAFNFQQKFGETVDE